jgi:stress-induced morphogen
VSVYKVIDSKHIHSELRRIFGHLQAAIVKKFDLGKETLDRHHQVAKYTCVR